MNDQAQALRRKILARHHQAKTISVISGKGGVGKSNFSLNFAISLSQLGRKVIIFDLDIGMGSIDILMGVSPKYTIADFFNQGIPLHRLIERGPENIFFIAGGSGLNHFIQLDEESGKTFLEQLDAIIHEFDYVIFDMGAGMSEAAMQFIMSTQDIFVIVTPEPTSIMDAYSAVKYLHLKGENLTYYLIGNRAKKDKEAQFALTKMSQAMQQFLDEKSEILGIIYDDPLVTEAVMRQMPFTLYKPNSRVALKLKEIATTYDQKVQNIEIKMEKPNFINKLSRLLFKR